MMQLQPPHEWEPGVEWLAAGLHGRNRWRLSPILSGMLFACGIRKVNSWLRAGAPTSTLRAAIISLCQWDARSGKHKNNGADARHEVVQATLGADRLAKTGVLLRQDDW